jgi:hypothetical protein
MGTNGNKNKNTAYPFAVYRILGNCTLGRYAKEAHLHQTISSRLAAGWISFFFGRVKVRTPSV